METNGKLTTRQWRLHDYIKSQSGRKVSKRDIYESMAGYEWHERASDKCPSIRTDMKAINASSECDIIIVFDHQKYYWGSKDEITRFIARKIRTIRTANKEIQELSRKLSLDGQGELLNNALNPADGKIRQTAREELDESPR